MTTWNWLERSVKRSQQITHLFQNTLSSVHQNYLRIVETKIRNRHRNMGRTWVLSAPGRPHVGPIDLDIRVPKHWLRHRTLRQDDCDAYFVYSTRSKNKHGHPGQTTLSKKPYSWNYHFLSIMIPWSLFRVWTNNTLMPLLVMTWCVPKLRQ